MCELFVRIFERPRLAKRAPTAGHARNRVHPTDDSTQQDEALTPPHLAAAARPHLPPSRQSGERCCERPCGTHRLAVSRSILGRALQAPRAGPCTVPGSESRRARLKIAHSRRPATSASELAGCGHACCRLAGGGCGNAGRICTVTNVCSRWQWVQRDRKCLPMA